jgi:hypothetical protein
MDEPEAEAARRAEFKLTHDTEAFDSSSDDTRVVLRWSGDEAEARRLQEEHTHHYLLWTLFGAAAVVIVGLIGVGLSFLH